MTEPGVGLCSGADFLVLDPAIIGVGFGRSGLDRVLVRDRRRSGPELSNLSSGFP